MKIKKSPVFCSVLVSVLLTGCASMGPPGGGPEDVEPPQIVEVNPTSGSTGVDPKADVEFIFSEPVDRESLIEALFITPPPTRKPRVKVRGRKARIILPEPIPSDRTLVVSLGSGVLDLRRNRLAQSYAVALTAGDRIDRGRISGLVFTSESLQGILVGAWIVDDSLDMNPAETPPEFLTQTGEDGGFVLDYLPAGDYRVACWDDRDRDRRYDPGSDRIGLPWRDVSLDEDSENWIELYPVKQDTSEPKLFVVSASDARHIVLRFSSILKRETAEILPELSVFDSSGVLGLQGAWLDAADSSRMVLFTETQATEGEYILALAGDTTLYSFKGSSQPDTIGPRVTASYPVGRERNISEIPAGWIGFNDALSDADSDKALVLYNLLIPETSDSLETPDSLVYNIRWRIENNLVKWEAAESIPFGTELTLQLDMTVVRDRISNLSSDTTWSVSFAVIDPAEIGSISGDVSGGAARPIVVARSLKGRGAVDTYGSTESDGTFKIDRLSAGDYRIWAFDDNNRNGTFDYGRLMPFSFAERFTVMSDTIKVRERWETGGVKVIFK